MRKIFFVSALLFSLFFSPVQGQETPEQKAEAKTSKQLEELSKTVNMTQEIKEEYKSILYKMNLEVIKASQTYAPEFEEYLDKIDVIRRQYDGQLGQVLEKSEEEQLYLERINKLKSLVEVTPRQEEKVKEILLAAVHRKTPPTLEGQILAVNVRRQKNTQIKRLFTPQQNKILIQNDFYLETPERECSVQDYLNGIKRNVELQKEQEFALKENIRSYFRMEDIAKLETDAQLADSLKNNASKYIYGCLGRVLSNEQWEQYLLNSSKTAAMKATAKKINVLKKREQYTEEQLTKIDKEIYNFLLSENILRTRYKYDDEKLQNGLREMKRLEPGSLRKASALEKLDDKAKAYRGTYQW